MGWVSPVLHRAAPTIRPFSHAGLLRDEPIAQCGTTTVEFYGP